MLWTALSVARGNDQTNIVKLPDEMTEGVESAGTRSNLTNERVPTTGKKDCQAAPQRKNDGQSHLTTVTTHSLVLIFVPQFPASGLWELVAQGTQHQLHFLGILHVGQPS